jgi:hypothetical protein
MDNFLRMTTTVWSLYRDAFRANILRFTSHEESYMVQGFSNLIFRHYSFLKDGYILCNIS